MRAFAEAWPNREFVQQVVAQISWGNNVVLLDRVKDIEQRKAYARLAAQHDSAFVRSSVRSVSELSPQTCQAYLRKRIRHGWHGRGVLNHIAAVWHSR